MDRSGCLAEGRGFGNLETATNRYLISTETREGRINSVFISMKSKAKTCVQKGQKGNLFSTTIV